MTRPWRISRRALLKGATASLALPLLEAMLPPTAWAETAPGRGPKVVPPKIPVRLAALYMPNGTHKDWTPAAEGPLAQLPPILQPLDKVKAEVLVLSQLWHAATNQGDGHYYKEPTFLTGTTIHKTTGADIDVGGVSLDQLAAQCLGQYTKLPSIELTAEPVHTGVDSNVGITEVYGGHISWSTPTTPVAREIDPKQAFDRLFRAQIAAADGAPAKRVTGLTPADDKSVLDEVMAESSSLRGRLGVADQRKLDEYLASVREVERRIQQEAKAQAAHRVDPLALQALPQLDDRVRAFHGGNDRRGQNQDHAERVRLMLDIIHLALWTDTTRVATFMFGCAVSGRSFSFLEGVSSGHHEVSHHEDKADKLEQYKRITTWHVQQLAYLLEKMKATKEAGGTLLDHSLVLFGSGIRDGNAHDPHDLPILLAGRGGNTLASGRHIRFKADTPLCNLFGEILARMGIQVERFADSTGPLPQLRG